MAYEMGLNVQKTCENGLQEAIKRLQGLNSDFTSVRNAVTNQHRFLEHCTEDVALTKKVLK
jgi:hypothetical protein